MLWGIVFCAGIIGKSDGSESEQVIFKDFRSLSHVSLI
jgi:hypothetical protein